MPTGPAIPSLLLVPDGGNTDYTSLYAIATAYAHSGLMLNRHAEKSGRLEFTFPALVCSSFALELFMKFFLTLANADDPGAAPADRRGHKLSALWQRLKPEHQDLIAGMHQNPTDQPLTTALDRRKELFLEALEDVGESPFVKWRYIHEVAEPTLMSHGAILNVLDALGHAAEHVMKGRRAAAAVVAPASPGGSATPAPA
jgi:hypothetical protein